ncbi:hypothetical protein FOA52_003554 [Chlamydomonas sp. UWO 241]|nr:hypothetical protein FOA52_003554 [Chlamydomonas sp. UWO 241]
MLVTTKVAVPLLGKIGGLLFRRGKGEFAQRKRPAAASATVDASPSEDTWRVLSAPPPPIPDDVKEIFSTKLDCSVRQFYEYFLSGSSDFHKALHIRTEKRDDFFYGPWRAATAGPAPLGSPANPDDGNYLAASGRSPFDFTLGASAGPGCFVRNLVFVQPKKGAQNCDAECRQRQQLGVFDGDVLVYATAMNMLNIPFKDCFTVNTAWVVRPAPGGGCTWSVHLKVNFVKGCLVGGIIRATTTSSTKDFFRLYAESAVQAVAAGGPPPAPPRAARASKSAAPAAMAASQQPPASAAKRAPASRVQSTPVERQLQVALLLMLLLVCLVHQGVLRRDVTQLRAMVVALKPRRQ